MQTPIVETPKRLLADVWYQVQTHVCLNAFRELSIHLDKYNVSVHPELNIFRLYDASPALHKWPDVFIDARNLSRIVCDSPQGLINEEDMFPGTIVHSVGNLIPETCKLTEEFQHNLNALSAAMLGVAKLAIETTPGNTGVCVIYALKPNGNKLYRIVSYSALNAHVLQGTLPPVEQLIAQHVIRRSSDESMNFDLKEYLTQLTVLWNSLLDTTLRPEYCCQNMPMKMEEVFLHSHLMRQWTLEQQNTVTSRTTSLPEY